MLLYDNASDLSATSRACRARGLLENDTTHGQTGSTTPQQTAGRPIRYGAWQAEREVARHARHPRIASSRGCRACRRGCHQDATLKLLPWNSGGVNGPWLQCVRVPSGECINNGLNILRVLRANSSSSVLSAAGHVTRRLTAVRLVRQDPDGLVMDWTVLL